MTDLAIQDKMLFLEMTIRLRSHLNGLVRRLERGVIGSFSSFVLLLVLDLEKWKRTRTRTKGNGAYRYVEPIFNVT